MIITIKYFGTFSQITGKRVERIDIVEDATVEHLLEILNKKYGGEFSGSVTSAVLLVNNKQTTLDKKLKSDDVVIVSHVVGGG
jgi:molybdopterin converting factor small subunit